MTCAIKIRILIAHWRYEHAGMVSCMSIIAKNIEENRKCERDSEDWSSVSTVRLRPLRPVQLVISIVAPNKTRVRPGTRLMQSPSLLFLLFLLA